MPLKVAIIGRPNVGKSTLFNRLAGKKLAIVHDKPGVTRDRKETEARLNDLKLTIIDTAGCEYSNEDNLEARMWEQTRKAIDEADVCLFCLTPAPVFSLTTSILPISCDVRTNRWFCLPTNAKENFREDSRFEAYKLGLGEPIPFSAEHGLGMLDLYDALKEHCFEDENEDTDQTATENEEETDNRRPIQIAIVGRPNVGKSTLVNALLQDERMLTGPEAGVTRDAITSDWEWRGRRFKLVDTTGLRRQSKVSDSLEKLSAASSRYAVNMAQVVVLVLDADAVLDKQDLTIASKVLDEGRALIIAVNKWDIANKKKRLTASNIVSKPR